LGEVEGSLERLCQRLLRQGDEVRFRRARQERAGHEHAAVRVPGTGRGGADGAADRWKNTRSREPGVRAVRGICDWRAVGAVTYKLSCSMPASDGADYAWRKHMAAITRSFSARDLLRALLFVPLAGLTMNAARAAESAVTIPAPAADAATPAGTGPQTIVLAGGCFWGVQAVFQHTKGVTAAVSGYAGGNKQTANYDMVGTGSTGHAESVALTFDPQQISYGKILQIYFSVAHNATDLHPHAAG